MKYILLSVILVSGMGNAFSQTGYQPDMSRALFHHKLDEIQKNLLKLDGQADELLTVDKDAEVNMQLTYQLTTRIDNLQKEIELDKNLESNVKVGYLRGLTDLLNAYGTEITAQRMSWNQLPQLISSYEDAMHLNAKGASILPAIQRQRYAVGQLISKNVAFQSNPGLQTVRENLFLKYLNDNPSLLLKELSRNSSHSFTDSLIKVAAKKMPEELFSYAQARQTPLGKKIAGVALTDPLVQLILNLSGQNSGQMYFPFLDRISSGELSRTDVAKALEDSTAYFKLLVQTQIAYAARLAKGDTPVAMKGLSVMLALKSYALYVNTINGLHDSPNAIRFKVIQKLSPQELYYLIVMNEESIYTSSYVYVYNRIFEVMNSKSSDSLMHLVNYDRYKKFITMASNYNTLDDFLGKMSRQNSTALMTNYVSNLDKGKSREDIEDAVDVANAFASIKQADIRNLMLNQVRESYTKAIMDNNRKGADVYYIEKLIMESNENPSINLTDSLGIPPVFEVKNKYMRDSAGRIILQMFFYGDEGGKGSFNHLMNLYSDRKKWALKSTDQWVQFTSIGTPVPFILFANRALDEEKDLDEQAQLKLIEYMNANGYQPSLTVHRGHSYFLKYTVDKMLPSSKVVVLGSCGAYQNLSAILKIAPDAYIISSKQVGYGEINIALFNYLIENLKVGKDIQWPTMMTTVAKGISAGKQGGYEDYVFPHKNLGAMFIKAYKIAVQKGGDMAGL
jgi:hypothetical protein